jgi:hypothetical protein
MEKKENIEDSPILDMQPVKYKMAGDDNIYPGIEGYAGELVNLVPYLVWEIKRLQREIQDIRECKGNCYMESGIKGAKTAIFDVKQRLAGISPVLVNGYPTLVDEQVAKWFPECYVDGKVNYKGILVYIIAIIKDLHL